MGRDGGMLSRRGTSRHNVPSSRPTVWVRLLICIREEHCLFHIRNSSPQRVNEVQWGSSAVIDKLPAPHLPTFSPCPPHFLLTSSLHPDTPKKHVYDVILRKQLLNRLSVYLSVCILIKILFHHIFLIFFQINLHSKSSWYVAKSKYLFVQYLHTFSKTT